MKSMVHPIRGRHETLSSMLATAMGDESLQSGIIFTFDKASVMSFGQIKLTRSQLCMAAITALAEAIKCMEQEDE